MVVDEFSALEDVADVWDAVAQRSGNLFATWDWVSTWWRHFGSRRPLAGVIARRPDGEPAVIVPLYVARRTPLTVLRFLGHGCADWLGPIHAPEDAALGARAMGAALAALPRWDLLLAEHLRSPQHEPSIGGSLVRRGSFPILRLEGRTWEDLLSDRSANFRAQVRRRERRLARGHRLSYRLTDAEHLEGDLDLLFRLHQARWAQEGGSDALSGPRQAFHREFARAALDRGWLRLWVMALEDEPVAAWYGFRYGGVEWYYQSGRDPAREADSVGFVLLGHTIRAALEDGADAYWLLRGDEQYKRRFADFDPGLETRAVANGRRGQAALMALRHIDRVPPAVRRRVVARA